MFARRVGAISDKIENGPLQTPRCRRRLHQQRVPNIIGILGNVAELGASRMEETIGKAKLRDAAIGTGIAVDKTRQLTDKAAPNINIAIVSMPTPEERELLNECHRRLRAVAIGESQDPSADVAWIAAYSKWEESGGPAIGQEPARLVSKASCPGGGGFAGPTGESTLGRVKLRT